MNTLCASSTSRLLFPQTKKLEEVLCAMQAGAAARAQALERDKHALAAALQARSSCQRLSVGQGPACGSVSTARL